MLAKARRPLIVAGLGAHRAGARKAIEALAEQDRRAARHHGTRQGSVQRQSPQSRHHRLVLAFHRAAHGGPGRLRAGVRRGPQFPHHELRHLAAAGAADPGRCGARQHRPLAQCRRGRGRRCAPGGRAARRGLPERPAADKPFHSEATRKLIAAFDPRRTSSRPTRPARSTRARSPWSSRSCCRRTATSWSTAAISSGVVPYLSVPDPGHFKMIGDFASIGLGFGAALGVAKAPAGQDHSAGDRRRRLPDDHGRARDGGARGPADGHRADERLRLWRRAAFSEAARSSQSAKSVFPDVDFAPIAEASASRPPPSARSRTCASSPRSFAKPEGPIFLDCKINADVAAPFMSEFAHFEGRH